MSRTPDEVYADIEAVSGVLYGLSYVTDGAPAVVAALGRVAELWDELMTALSPLCLRPGWASGAVIECVASARYEHMKAVRFAGELAERRSRS